VFSYLNQIQRQSDERKDSDSLEGTTNNPQKDVIFYMNLLSNFQLVMKNMKHKSKVSRVSVRFLKLWKFL
jgi:hypothetical protein